MVIHILLLVLKILGIIILSVLGLLIFVLLLLLLVPIRYHIIGLSDDRMELNIRITYLLKFFKASFGLSKEEKSSVISIFWGLIKIKPKKKPKDYSKDFIEPDEIENENKEEDNEDFEEELTEASEDADDEFSSKDEKKNSSKTLGKKSKKNHTNILSKIRNLKDLYLTEANKRAVSYLIKQIFYILRKYLPRKATGNLYFGMSDPAMTGEILGVLSVIPLMYQRGLNIYPDFDTEELYIKGKLDVSGFIQLGVIIIVVFRLILNKDTRSLIKILLKK